MGNDTSSHSHHQVSEMVQPTNSAEIPSHPSRRVLNDDNGPKHEMNAKAVGDQVQGNRGIYQPRRSTRNVNPSLPPTHPRPSKTHRNRGETSKKVARKSSQAANLEDFATLQHELDDMRT